jgi:hypothetical protein
MKRWECGLLIMAVLALGLSAMEGNTVAAEKKAGYALLDMFVKAFQDIAARGTGGEELEALLPTMAVEVKRAKESGEINLVFFSRYTRVLALTALLVKPDKENLLAPVIDRELADFIKDVTGEHIATGQGPVIGQVANALAEELVNLQLYLDTLDKREAMRKKFDEGMKPSPRK